MYYYKLYDWTLKSDIKIDYLEEQNNIINKNYLEIKIIDIEQIKILNKKIIIDKSEENIIIFETDIGYLIKYFNNDIIVSSKYIYFQIMQQFEMQMEIFLSLGITMLFVDRNIIPFHGAAIVMDDTVFIMAAESNSGKSTLLLNLLKMGYKLYADDLIPIKINEKGCFGIQSNLLFIRLWEDIIKKYNIKNQKKEIIHKTGKYRVFFKENLIGEFIFSNRIKEIIILNTNYEGRGIVTKELTELNKLIKLFELTHGTLLLKEFIYEKLFKKYIIMNNEIKVTEWQYKKNYKNLKKLIKMISERDSNVVKV